MVTVCALIQDQNSPHISVIEIFSRKIPCLFIGIGIGMLMYSGNNFHGIWSLKIWLHGKFPGKCWINITKITMVSHGSLPCIQQLNKLVQSNQFF